MNNHQAHGTCVLDAGGYQVVFRLRAAAHSSDHLDGTVEILGSPEFGIAPVRSQPMFLAKHDLLRFSQYLERHIATLRERPSSEAPIFVPLELGFQAQALGGEVVDSHDGEFTLRFMVQVGVRGDDGSRVYYGAEAAADVGRVRDFLEALQSQVRELAATL